MLEGTVEEEVEVGVELEKVKEQRGVYEILHGNHWGRLMKLEEGEDADRERMSEDVRREW